jgi:protein SCO1
MNKSKLGIGIVLAFGFLLFWFATDGFQAFTSETARTYTLEKDSPIVPAITLLDSKNRTYPFSRLAEGKYTFVTFIYTNCGTVCPQLEMSMEKVYHAIPEKYFEKDITFLSISFDPIRDTPEALATYSSYFDSDEENWRMATVPNKEELNKLLNTLGVVVIPDGYGNFQHNSAFYLLGKQGQLLEVMDFTNTTLASDTLLSYLAKEGER